MSGKGFVRASKYRHVHGKAAKKEHSYNDVRLAIAGEGNYIKANTKWFCINASGGGGPVIVHSLKQTGRLPLNHPVVNVHTAAVVDFDFCPVNEDLLATASDDCKVKVTVIPPNGLTENILNANATMSGHGKKPSFIHWHPTAENVLASSGYDNLLKVWDVSQQAEKYSYSVPDSIHSFEWSHDGSLIAVSSKDRALRMYDPRNEASVQTINEAFEGVKTSRLFWVPEKNWIGAVGFSKSSTREIRLWDCKKLGQPLSVTELDQTAGVLIPFYDSDLGILYVGGKGDGNIRYYEITDEAPYCHFLSEYRTSIPQKGLAVAGKRSVDTSQCEIANFLRLCKDFIEPVSMEVPRKSDVFQKDIYPDTFSGQASMTAEEYFGGANKPPILTPIKPIEERKEDAPKAAPVISSSPKTEQKQAAAGKSAAELQKELDAANKRIAELEAQLAAKQ